MDSIHDSLRYVHGGGPIPSTVTGHKSGSVKTVPVMCHTSYCHGYFTVMGFSYVTAFFWSDSGDLISEVWKHYKFLQLSHHKMLPGMINL